MKTRTAIAAVTVLALAASANAALVLYEGFDYPAGDIDGSQAGGTGFSATGWTTAAFTRNPYDVRSTGLSFTGLPTVGLSVRRPSAPDDAEMHRGISAASQAALTADNSTIWFSTLMADDRYAGRHANAALMLGSGALTGPGGKPVTMAGGEGFGVAVNGQSDNSFRLHAIAIDGGTSSLSTEYIPTPGDQGTTFLVAGKIDWAPNGSNDTLTLYNITDPAAPLPSSFATVSADLDQSVFDTVAMGDRQITPFDEIRFGNTFADVMEAGGGPPPGPSGLPIIDDFDNGDLGTDVNGVNGGFTKRSNSGGGAGSASEAGTDATMVTTGSNDNTGIVSNNSFDAASTAPSGFEMSFSVTSLSSDPANNGMFLGLQDDGTSFFRNIENFGLVFSGNESRTSSGGGFGLVLNDIGSSGADIVFDHADLELSSLLDGFEATILADAIGWAYEIIGVNDTSGAPATFSGADAWVNAGLSADFFSTFFDNADHVAAWTQRGGGGNPQITTTIDGITVATVGEADVIPEPATLSLLGLGALLALRRRRRGR